MTEHASKDFISPSALTAALSWRYATKRFDAARSIPDETWAALEQALHLSPSSFGLQPWKFLVIDDPATRAALRIASWNQPQVTEASRLVVLARRSPLGREDIARTMRHTEMLRVLPLRSLESYEAMIERFVTQDAFDVDAWTARQVYLALGVFLTSAALLGIDACPLEGFEPDRYDDLLGLQTGGYRATVVVAAGYRAADDPHAASVKVRHPVHEVIVRHAPRPSSS